MLDTLEKIGFFDLLKHIASFCSTEMGGEVLMSLRPIKERALAEEELRKTEEMRLLLKLIPNLGIAGVRDIRGIYPRLTIEGTYLEPQELLLIRDLLGGYNLIRSGIASQRELLPLLWGTVEGVEGLKEIIRHIDRVISPEGEIRDDASPKLIHIRRQKVKQRQIILNKYEAIIREKGIRLEQEISVRGGRYVIPLRADERSKLKGIVHDYSRSKNTCFVEPFTMVPENNRLHELQEEERQEIEKILRELTGLLRPVSRELILIRDTFAYLDSLLAKARFAQAYNLKSPEFCWEGISIKKAKNPLLLILMREEGLETIPVDLEIKDGEKMLVVCGPNRGGKTVALRTLGLISLMAQTGIPIPAEEGSRLTLFEEILAEMGDEQDVFSGESTFSAHAKGLANILSKAREDTLILVDEPGKGTSPEEGSAIAMAVLEKLLDTGAICMVTTHYNSLKAWALGRPKVKVASVGFDLETQSPNFRLTYGILGSSYGLEMAKKSGIPETIIERARSFMDPGHQRMEETLNSLESKLRQLERLEAEFQEGIQKNREGLEEIQKRESELKRSEQVMLENGRLQIERLFEQAKKEIALLINQFKTQRGKSQLITQKTLGELRNRILKGLEPKEGLDIKGTSRLKVGDLVRHGGSGQTGRVVKLSDQKALVQFSGLKAEVALSSLELVEGSEAKGCPSTLSKWDLGGPFVLELNVIGKRVPEAISMVEKAINRALVEGRDELRIVHGHGSGQLRRAIREHLSQYPHVKGLRSEDPSLGGEAVTVVEL